MYASDSSSQVQTPNSPEASPFRRPLPKRERPFRHSVFTFDLPFDCAIEELNRAFPDVRFICYAVRLRGEQFDYCGVVQTRFMFSARYIYRLFARLTGLPPVYVAPCLQPIHYCVSSFVRSDNLFNPITTYGTALAEDANDGEPDFFSSRLTYPSRLLPEANYHRISSRSLLKRKRLD